MSDTADAVSAAGPWRTSLAAALPGWVVARVLLATGWLTAEAIARHTGDRTLQLDQGLFLWDGAFYRDIAEFGYGGVADEALRFFPLYPLLGRVLGLVPFLGAGAALVLVANVAALAAGAFLHRLVVETTGDDHLARRSAWVLALFPAGFVLAAAYAEALLLALVLGALLAARRDRWWTAALLAVGAGACRPLGLLVLIPLAALAGPGLRAAWHADGGVAVRAGAARAAAVLGGPVGLAAVLAHSAWLGRGWRAPLTIQEPLRGAFVLPPVRLVQAVGDLFGPERTGDGLHAPFAVGFVALVVVGARRVPRAWTLLSAVVVAVALAAENLNSFERYGLAAFPLVVALASVGRTPPRRQLVDAVLAGGTVALVTMSFLGVMVP